MIFKFFLYVVITSVTDEVGKLSNAIRVTAEKLDTAGELVTRCIHICNTQGKIRRLPNCTHTALN